MKLYKLLIILLGFTLVIQSCNKDRIAELEPEVTSSPVFDQSTTGALLREMRKDSTLSPINSDGELPFIGPEGTKIWVYPHNLLDENNNPISYPYQIEILELYSPKDMILYNIPTVSNGELLVSGGEFRIRAWKDGKLLKANPDENIYIEVPAETPDAKMTLFLGGQSRDEANWVETNPVFIGVDSLQREVQTNYINLQTGNYGVNINELGWINCDYFYGSGNEKTNITLISADSSVALDFAMKYFYFPSINSMMSFVGNSAPAVDIDLPGTLICIAADTSGVPYFYMSDQFISANGLLLEVSMQKSTSDEIEVALNSLGL